MEETNFPLKNVNFIYREDVDSETSAETNTPHRPGERIIANITNKTDAGLETDAETCTKDKNRKTRQEQ